MKRLFGETQITKENHPDLSCSYMELEYYKIKKRNRKTKSFREKSLFYGIEIVKKEVNGRRKKVEKEKMDYITSNENNIHKMLSSFKKNLVTPMGLKESVVEWARTEEI